MFRKLSFVLLTLMLVVSACGPTITPVPTVAPISLTDGLGRVVTLAHPAPKIVSLAPSNTEILFAIGAGKQTIGRDEFSDYPTEAKSLPSVGGSMGKYNIEQIAALKPDLVLAAEINTPEQVKALTDLGLTVYYLSNPKTLEDLYTNLETVAKLTGHATEAAALVDSLKKRVAAVDARILPLNSRPMVYYEIDATDPTKPYTYGPGSFGDLLLQRAGGANVGSSLSGQFAQMSLEQLVVANPAIIILGDSNYGTTADSLKKRTGWEELDAVKNSQVFPFDDNLVSRPGPRLVDGLEALAKLLHPDLFK